MVGNTAMETVSSRAQRGHFIALYWEILPCSEVQSFSLFPHCQYAVAHHDIWNMFPDWKVIAGVYSKTSKCLCTTCLASKGLLVGILPCWLSPSATAHHSLSCAEAQENVFISGGDAFRDAVGERASVISVLPLPSWAGLCPLPRWPGCSWDNAHTAWCEVLSLTHSSGVIVDRAGSATGNWNRS